MEEWQREYIIDNLPKLTNQTICRKTLVDILQSRGVIGDGDIALLEAIPDKYDKSSTLYSLLQTREGAYKVLVEVLGRDRQTGAQAILRNGTRLNIEISHCGNEGPEACIPVMDENVRQDTSRNVPASDTLALLNCDNEDEDGQYSGLDPIQSGSSGLARRWLHQNRKIRIAICIVLIYILCLVATFVVLINKQRGTPLQNSTTTISPSPYTTPDLTTTSSPPATTVPTSSPASTIEKLGMEGWTGWRNRIYELMKHATTRFGIPSTTLFTANCLLHKEALYYSDRDEL